MFEMIPRHGLLRDFLQPSISAEFDDMDLEVFDSITDGTYPSVGGRYYFTEEAYKEFPALMYPCKRLYNHLIVECDDIPDCREVYRLTKGLAGYMSMKRYNECFIYHIDNRTVKPNYH